jgi:hypothetical protein
VPLRIKPTRSVSGILAQEIHSHLDVKRVRPKQSTLLGLVCHHPAGFDVFVRPTPHFIAHKANGKARKEKEEVVGKKLEYGADVSGKSRTRGSLDSRLPSAPSALCSVVRSIRLCPVNNRDEADMEVMRKLPAAGWQHLACHRRPGCEHELQWWVGLPAGQPRWPRLVPLAPSSPQPALRLQLRFTGEADVLHAPRLRALEWIQRMSTQRIAFSEVVSVESGLLGGALYERFARAYVRAPKPGPSHPPTLAPPDPHRDPNPKLPTPCEHEWLC